MRRLPSRARSAAQRSHRCECDDRNAHAHSRTDPDRAERGLQLFSAYARGIHGRLRDGDKLARRDRLRRHLLGAVRGRDRGYLDRDSDLRLGLRRLGCRLQRPRRLRADNRPGSSDASGVPLRLGATSTSVPRAEAGRDAAAQGGREDRPCPLHAGQSHSPAFEQGAQEPRARTEPEARELAVAWREDQSDGRERTDEEVAELRQ